MIKHSFILTLCVMTMACVMLFGQTTTVTVNTTTKVTQPPVGVLSIDGATGFKITRGTGTPEGSVSATPGSLYLDQNGLIWVKNTGIASTGWGQLGGAGAVSSVFGRTGAVTAQSGDYSAFYEPGLGNPGTSGFVLSSTTGGTRSWIAPAAGGGAPTTADYLVRTADGTLSAERVVTDTTSIIWDWATAGQSKATRAALTGDITAPANSNATTYSNAVPTTKGGLPTGGTTGQALTKINATDYNTQWTTLGGGSGTVTSITATAPIVVTPTPLTSTGVISVTGAALTKTDDTNVTLTLGGTPTTALLAASSLTLGWTGTLAIARGGTGAATAGANTVFGNNTASTAAPVFSSSPRFTAIGNLTTDGFVKTSGAVGTLSVDTATYQPADADLATWAGITPGTGVGTFLATPTSTNLRGALTDENGTGAALFSGATTPDFTTGITIGAAAAARKMLVGDGTKFAASTETWAVPGASTNNVLKSDGTNWTAAQLGFSNLSGNWTLAQGPSTTASALLGRTSASAGIPQEITLGSGFSMSGTTLNYAGVVGGAPIVYTQTSQVSPTGTTSSTGVMAGLAATLTPVGTGKVFVTVTGTLANTVLNGSTAINLRYGTGTAPVNGAAPTGTFVGSNIFDNSLPATATVPFSVSGVISGLTTGTPIWIDVSFAALSGGGTASMGNVSVAAFELPSATVSDTAFGVGWNGVTDTAPSKNAVYDQMITYEPGLGNPGTNGYVLSSTTGGTRSWIAPGGGGAPITATYITEVPDITLSNEFALSSLATGLLKNTTTTGVPTIAVAKTDYWDTTDFVASGASGAHGLVPSPGTTAGTTKFLREDATWAVPAGGGGGTPGGSTTQVQFNDAGAFAGDTNFTIDKTNHYLTAWGIRMMQGPGGPSSAWIDIPTTGASGIGSGGAGSNVWLGYAASAGQFFSNAAAGDIIYRPNPGRILIGTRTDIPALVFPSNSLLANFGSSTVVGWTSGDPAGTSADTGLARNASGVVEVNNGTAGTYRDAKMRTLLLNPGAAPTGVEGALYGNSTDHKIYYHNGTSFVDLTAGGAGGTPGGTNGQIQYNNSGAFGGFTGDAGSTNNFLTGISSSGVTKAQPSFSNLSGTASSLQRGEWVNASTSSQTLTTADTYIAGSGVVVGAGNWAAGGQYKCRFEIVKTAAGTAPLILNVRVGTGVVGDTAILGGTFVAAQTAVIDTMIIDFNVNIRTIGASATSAGNALLTHSAASGAGYGLTANVMPWQGGQLATFNSTTATTIGLSFNGGASHSGTITTVQASYMQ